MGITAVVDAVARELTLFAAAGLLVGGVDDLVIDLIFLARLALRRGDRDARLADLPTGIAEARLAVMIPAWGEAGVIGTTLARAVQRYAYGDYLIFVAAYPNDPGTIDAIAAVAERDSRVRLVINPRPGPTTKADNLNAAWAALEREEAASGRPFAALLLHDAEDLVHPDELAVCAALIGDGAAGVDVVQLPVVPLVHATSRFVSGHYADEFSEGNSPLPQLAALAPKPLRSRRMISGFTEALRSPPCRCPTPSKRPSGLGRRHTHHGNQWRYGRPSASPVASPASTGLASAHC